MSASLSWAIRPPLIVVGVAGDRSQTAMYAVIATGGKQERVSEGQQVAVELLGAEEGAEVCFPPVLVVDGDTVLATPAQLSGASVTGRVLGEIQGSEDQRLHLQAEGQ